MKVYKIELMYLDFDNIDIKEIENIITSNRFLHPSILSIDSREIGEWYDEHPLNKEGFKEEIKRLF